MLLFLCSELNYIYDIYFRNSTGTAWLKEIFLLRYSLLRLPRFFVTTREYSGFHSWWKAKSLRILDRISKTVLCFLRPCPILAVLCFLKQRAHFLIATPEKKRIESLRCHAVCQRHHTPATMAKYSWPFFLSSEISRTLLLRW